MNHPDLPATPRRILAVDDTPANLGIIADYLEQHGYETLSARDGKRGLSLAMTRHPDLILLDIMMPEMDGFEVCRRLKAEPATRHIPVIFMTALAGTEDKIKGFAAGGVDYVTKPMQQEEVLARIETHLKILDYERALEQASRFKSAFLASMSHELRTPLNSILILSQLLANNKPGNLEPQQIEYAQTIKRSGTDLMTLINDILDLSKVEAGKMEFHIEPVAVADMLTAMDRIFHPVAQEKGVELIFKTEAEAPVRVRTDGMRFQQALKNLIANAIKFTDHGSVTIATTAYHGEEVPGAGLAISVTDSGIGIAPEDLAAVFDPYKQAQPTTSHRFGGTGLGLSISHNLIQGLGGALRLRSTVGVGSTFTIYLPVGDVPEGSTGTAATPQQEATPLPPPARLPGAGPVPAPPVVQKSSRHTHEDDARLAGKHILLVDDDMRSIYSVTGILEHLQITVTPATNGQEALDALDRHPTFDLVLMDIAMPEVDGFAAIRALRTQDRFRALPVIALTAQAMKGDREKCLEAGASDYFAKPIVIDVFVAMLRKWLLP